jgi:hypothetical protein
MQNPADESGVANPTGVESVICMILLGLFLLLVVLRKKRTKLKIELDL